MSYTIPSLVLSKTTFYSFRIKNVKHINLDNTFKFLNKKKKNKYLLLSLEDGQGPNGVHIHGMIGNNHITTQKVREYIKKMYPDAKGNKCLSVTIVKDVKQMSKYILKEGKYQYKGFDADFIRTMHKCSNKKEKIAEKIHQMKKNY